MKRLILTVFAALALIVAGCEDRVKDIEPDAIRDQPPMAEPETDAPAAVTPEADTPPYDTPATDTPPTDTPPADTPPADAVEEIDDVRAD